MHAFRTFLGDDDDFFDFARWSVVRFFLITFFVCLWPGFFGDFVALFRVFVVGLRWRFGSGVGLRVRSL